MQIANNIAKIAKSGESVNHKPLQVSFVDSSFRMSSNSRNGSSSSRRKRSKLDNDSNKTTFTLSRQTQQVVARALRFSDHSGLRDVTITNCGLTDIPVGLLPVNLLRLDVSCNELTSIGDLSALSNLGVLLVEYNRLTNCMGIESNTKLRELSLAGNRISSIHGLQSLKNLRILNLELNPISDTVRLSQDLCVYTKLSKLQLAGTPVTQEDDAQNTLQEVLGSDVSISFAPSYASPSEHATPRTQTTTHERKKSSSGKKPQISLMDCPIDPSTLRLLEAASLLKKCSFLLDCVYAKYATKTGVLAVGKLVKLCEHIGIIPNLMNVNDCRELAKLVGTNATNFPSLNYFIEFLAQAAVRLCILRLTRTWTHKIRGFAFQVSEDECDEFANTAEVSLSIVTRSVTLLRKFIASAQPDDNDVVASSAPPLSKNNSRRSLMRTNSPRSNAKKAERRPKRQDSSNNKNSKRSMMNEKKKTEGNDKDDLKQMVLNLQAQVKNLHEQRLQDSDRLARQEVLIEKLCARAGIALSASSPPVDEDIEPLTVLVVPQKMAVWLQAFDVEALNCSQTLAELCKLTEAINIDSPYLNDSEVVQRLLNDSDVLYPFDLPDSVREDIENLGPSISEEVLRYVSGRVGALNAEKEHVAVLFEDVRGMAAYTTQVEDDVLTYAEELRDKGWLIPKSSIVAGVQALLHAAREQNTVDQADAWESRIESARLERLKLEQEASEMKRLHEARVQEADANREK